MLLQSKKPQPSPNRTRKATAAASVPAWPTPNIAGTMRLMPIALVKMRPRSWRRIQRSATKPPPSAPTIAATCQ